jgi:uncharacterized protein (TIGR03663 family)
MTAAMPTLDPGLIRDLPARVFGAVRGFVNGDGQHRGARWAELAAYVSLIGVAAGMRLWDLGSRALHHDESLHAYFSWQLSEGQSFVHNPMMHGPLQFEANAGVFFLFGASDFTARILYVIAGVAIVAVPYLLRDRLGRIGALATATMLAFSPSMLYFSRFARNDILMALWTLGLVAFMWRYMDSGKNRYLYGSAALLGLAFSTKESAYLVTGIMALFLGFLVVKRGWERIHAGLGRDRLYGVSPAVAAWRIVAAGWGELFGEGAVAGASRPASLLILIGALTLPLWSAFVSVLQSDGSNLVLAAKTGNIGAPSGGGVALATIVVIALALVSVYIGWRWRWGVWWRAVLIFYLIFIPMHTTFFTNCSEGFSACFGGVGSGFWRGLGYWIVQQGEARGNQPGYYYFILTPLYEFLPLFLAGLAAIYYWKRPDPLGRFLIYWALITFVVFTFASEKMPWLLVNITLPLIVLGGKFFGDLVGRLRPAHVLNLQGIAVSVWVVLLGFLLWNLALFGEGDASNALWLLLVLLIGTGGVIYAGFYLRSVVARRPFAAMAVMGVVAVLAVITVIIGARAAYKNGDVPVEMIVYTQTSPDIPQLARVISNSSSDGEKPRVTIDGTSGFQWPWAWYLRDIADAGYPNYDGAAPSEAPDVEVLVVHASNEEETAPVLEGEFGEGVRVKHRWWFPEQAYRGLTLSKFVKSFGDRDSWRRAMDYFLYRKVNFRLGSEDAFVFFSDEQLRDFTPTTPP